METTINQENLLNEISTLTVINQIVETIYVEEPTGSINISKVVKDGNEIKTINNDINYKLKDHRIIVKSDECFKSNLIITDNPNKKTIKRNQKICNILSTDINNIFINELQQFKNIEKGEYKYYKQNFFKKLFKKNKKEELIEYILKFSQNCSWAIVPMPIWEIIKESEWFERTSLTAKSLIFCSGQLHGLNIFINPSEDDKVIYFGNFDSIIIVINKNIKTEKLKCISNVYTSGTELMVSYTFIENGLTKALSIK